jgi:hypothetical protein
MPIMECTMDDGTKGYKYGDSGKCYKEKQKAILQGVAISQNSDEKLELSKEDMEYLMKEIGEDKKFEPMMKNEELQMLFGWTYVAQRPDGEMVIDHSGEFVKEENFEDLENATYIFNIAYRQADIRHSCVAKGILIESVVMTKEKQKAMGIPEGIVPLGVWQGYWFPDKDDWSEIRKMKSPMYSLYGSAVKELIEEVEDV